MNTRYLSAAILAAALSLAAACAGTREEPRETQAIRDYVEVGELAEADAIRTRSADSWKPLTEHFAIYEAREGSFLLEFSRRCWEMFDNTKITPDKRYDHNRIRQGMDTLRGCRIDRIYPLTEAQAEEVAALAESAGGGN